MYPLSGFLSACPRSLAALCREPALAEIDLRSALFLDTETTGLDPRAGSYAFLVGVGYFSDDGFEIDQFFIEGPNHERAMLRALADTLHGFGLLVTFNGRAFDVPMLAHRLALHGQAHSLRALPHADLLHAARRLWKERLQSCRLANLERHILRVERSGDVPSSQVPALYARYRADGDPRRLLPVFHHNAQDIMTLLALATHAAATFARPFAGIVRDGPDFASLARAYEAAGDSDLALQAYDRALGLPLHPAARADACRRASALYKRRSQTGNALALWEEMVRCPRAHSIYPFEELAKHYEHEAHDYARAEELVVQALRLLPGDACTHTTRRDLEKRLHRIRDKLRSVRET
jgi:uncharacterized protein YprB with RNaseH-like and TPR domain